MRMYLCPLAVLLVFAIGVLVLSVLLPRIQERSQNLREGQYPAAAYGITLPGNPHGKQGQQVYVPASADDAFGPDEPFLDEARSPEDLSFDPLLDEFAPSVSEEPIYSEETEQTTSAPEENP